MEKLPVSVIVVARNGEQTLRECLEAIRQNSPAEIIVVDGQSTDRTVAISKEYTDKIFSDGGKGLGYARQIGAEKASSEYIAYIDSHVILIENDALSRMLADIRNSGHVAVSARLTSDMSCSDYWEWGQYQHEYYSQKNGHRTDYLSTYAGLIRRETVLRYKFNFASKVIIDDFDLTLKLKKAGYTFGNSSALYRNYYRRGLKKIFLHRMYNYGRPSVYYMKYWGPWHIEIWAPLTTLYWLVFSIAHARFKLLPYFIMNGVAQSCGMLIGIGELVSQRFGKIR